MSIPTPPSGFRNRWCPRLLTGLVDGDPISTFTDFGWAGKSFTAAGSARPTYKEALVNRYAVARLDGVANVMTQAVASDFKFLSDGSPHTICVVFSATGGSNPNAQYCLLDNCGAVDTNVGMFLALDDRSGSSRNNRVTWLLSRGVASNLTFSDTGADNDIVQGRYTSIIASYDEGADIGHEHRLSVDNWITRTGDSTNSPSSSDPTSVLKLGASSAGTMFAAMDLAEVLIWDRMLSASELQDLNRYICHTYPATLNHNVASTTLGLLPSLGYDAFPGICPRRSASGPLVLAWESASTHVALGDHSVIVQAITDDGWHVKDRNVAMTDSAYGTRGVSLSRISDDRLVMSGYSYNIQSLGPVLNGAWWAEATTFESSGIPIWGTKTYFADGFTGWAACQGPVILLANGDWVAPIYGLMSGGVFTSIRMLRRTAGSGAFGSEVVIAAGPLASKDYNECMILEYSAGNLIAAVRNETDLRIDFVFSTDSGATWGSVQTGFSAGGVPKMMKDAAGTIYMIYRNQATGISNFAYSVNNGVTWFTGFPFNRRGQTSMYGEFARFDNDESWLVHSWELSSISSIIDIKKWENAITGQDGGIGPLLSSGGVRGSIGMSGGMQ